MKIALMGLKGHHNVVLEGARELGDCELVAVSHDDADALAEFQKSEPMAAQSQTFGNWRHLLEHSMPDVCCVCDENGMRAEQLIELLQRGVHIVTEKPLTTTREDLARVSRALAASQSKLTMLLTMRHEAKYATMRQLIQEGVVGKVAQVSSQKSYRLGERPEWQRSRARLGGTIPFIGIHAVDLMHWVTGLDYTHVAAFHGNNGKPEMKETEDHASLALRFASGASATARLDYLRPMSAPTHGDDRLRIAGGDGVLEATGGDEDLTLLATDQEPRRIPVEATSNLFVDFVQAMREGREPRIRADDCFYATDVVLRARQAADTWQLLEVPPRKDRRPGE